MPGNTVTVTALTRYERLVNAALVVATAGTAEDVKQLLGVLQSRAVIEQAKGAVIGLLGCDADTAWATLRRASQEFNVKLRDFAAPSSSTSATRRPNNQPRQTDPA